MIVSGAGFSMTEEEWPEVESPTLGKVNALYHMLSGFEFEPGTPWTYSVCAQTFTGQIAQWCDPVSYTHLTLPTILLV